MVRHGPTHTPLFFQLANWGEPKVLHAIEMCQIQEVFRIITLLTCSSSSQIFCRLAGHNVTPYLRHVISLFCASKQTLGPSREHERDDGHAPEVQGPATNIRRTGRTTEAFCSRAEKRLSHCRCASANTFCNASPYICSRFQMQRKLATDCD